ncbi:MAG: hypothetical protein WA063_07165, partial [Minisyncoccia bacterium]
MPVATEFWQAYDEALETGNQKLIKQFESNDFTEWLDAVYEKDEDGNVYITEHPEVERTRDGFEYKGKRKKVEIPEGRPGWFDPKDNIDLGNIAPSEIDLKRKKDAAYWKYWSVYQVDTPVSPMRGYVTLSGTPSFDLDVPSESKQPVLMFRECRDELPETVLPRELLDKAEEIIRTYLSTISSRPGMRNEEEQEKFYQTKDNVLAFVKESGRDFLKLQDTKVREIKEKIIDMLGLLHLMAEKKNDLGALGEINAAAKELFGIDREKGSFDSFRSFVDESVSKLKESLEKKKKIVFVMGHKNPDTDTIVSSLTEAYRNSLIDKETEYIPLIQGQKIPDEVRRLVGDE